MCLQPKGSSFEGNDKDYLRLRIGESKMIPAVQDALLDMKVGGVRWASLARHEFRFLFFSM